MIVDETRISPRTLSRMADNSIGMVGLSIVDRLCAFFPCTRSELMLPVQENVTPPKENHVR